LRRHRGWTNPGDRRGEFQILFSGFGWIESHTNTCSRWTPIIQGRIYFFLLWGLLTTGF
jgi:hypothetical protein